MITDAWSGHASVRGNVMPYNNKRTDRPQDDDEKDAAVKQTKKAHWKTLIGILSTDIEMDELIDRIEGSQDMHCIIIKNAVEAEPQGKLVKLLRRSSSARHHMRSIAKTFLTH